MTETGASFKKNRNRTTVSDGRISTHPSYTEYSFDALTKGPSGNTGTLPRVENRRPVGASSAPKTAKKPEKAKRAQTAARSAAAKPKITEAEAAKSRAEKKERIRKKSMVAIHTIVVEKKYSFPVSIVLVALAFTILIMSTVTTLVQISEITAENALLEREHYKLLSEENELRLLLETRDDLRIVETLAKEEYGMVKKDQVERYYLAVHKEDKIEIIEEVEAPKTGIFDGIMSFGGSLAKRIRGFFGF